MAALGVAALAALALSWPAPSQALIGGSPLQPVGLFCVAKQSGPDLAYARASYDELVNKDAELIGSSPLAFPKPCIDTTDADFFNATSGICEDLLGAVYGGFDTGLDSPAVRSPQCAAAGADLTQLANFRL